MIIVCLDDHKGTALRLSQPRGTQFGCRHLWIKAQLAEWKYMQRNNIAGQDRVLSCICNTIVHAFTSAVKQDLYKPSIPATQIQTSSWHYWTTVIRLETVEYSQPP